MSTNEIFIPSKGRSHCVTARYLSDIGYPAPWHIVLGDDDETITDYEREWGSDRIIVFDKASESAKTDMMDAWGHSRPTGVAPARNFIASHAKDMGLKRFWLFDDDYKSMSVKHVDGRTEEILDGDELFELFDEMEEFGLETGMHVVGFLYRDWTRGVGDFSPVVYNGHNIGVDGFWKFSARMYDDSVHAIAGMRVGMPDFGFYHVFVNLAEQQFHHNKKSGGISGGMVDVYDSGEEESQADKERLVKVRDAGYQIIASPICLGVRFDRDKVRIAHSFKSLVPKYVNERYALR